MYSTDTHISPLGKGDGRVHHFKSGGKGYARSCFVETLRVMYVICQHAWLIKQQSGVGIQTWGVHRNRERDDGQAMRSRL